MPSAKFRIAVLGNSHTGALYKAWAGGERDAFPGLALSFFARPNGQGTLRALQLRGNKLVTDDDGLRNWLMKTGGVDHIDVGNFDAFILCGFGLDPDFLYRIVNRSAQSYSSQLVQVLLADRLQTLLVHKLAEMIRSVTEAPIFCIDKPLFSTTYARQQKVRAVSGEDYDRYMGMLQKVLGRLGCIVVRQPESTIEQGGFTQDRFAGPDLQHMNTDYGKEVIRDFMRAYEEMWAKR